MKFLAMYRASFYLMLTFATLVLSVDATDDNPLAMLYPLVVAGAGLLAFFLIDLRPRFHLSRDLASLLALLSGGLSVAEYQYDKNLLLLSAAHWLVYLQLIKMFLPKTVEDDWFLFLLGLVQVLVGGVISQSDHVGIALVCWAVTSLWVLTLFALRREAIRMDRVPFGSNDLEPLDRAEPYRGLFDAAFVFATIRVSVITLTLGGLIFLAMPRRLMPSNAIASDSLGRHLSGFDDEVQLGQLGEILENDNIVMSIEQFDKNNNHHSPSDDQGEQRWRGVTLDRYDHGRWRRPRLRNIGATLSLPPFDSSLAVVRQMIKLEPTDSPVLFGLRPIVGVSSTDKRFDPELNEIDGSIYRGDSRAVVVDYQVVSAIDPTRAQTNEVYPSQEYLGNLLSVPADVLESIRPIAENVVQDIDPADHRARVMALDRYLRDPASGFSYSLAMDSVDPSIDPVVDFLLNRKEGHCEYFASALALLIRAVDIPARVVNGFKGGDYNAVAGLTTVRQKHAHSWVEALVEPRLPRGNRAFWLTLDPTPADQRNESIAKVGGMIGNFRQLTDLIRYIWVFYIVGFNAERQNRFLYGPILALLREARRGFGMIGQALLNLLHFPSLDSFFSVRGFVVSFLALLILAGLIRLLVGLGRLIWRKTRGIQPDNSPQRVGDQFYRRLLSLLERVEIRRPIAETPREFARRAAAHLAGRGAGVEAVADVPPLIVDAFYRIRFGHHALSDADQHLLAARLDALEARLNPQQSPAR